jgi:phenylpropionate dioxygenase-like ring-hydroxylating dioxygenase large terminal subunit
MATVIEHPSYFTSLPREYYMSDAIFEQELDRVFNRQWLYAGQASQVPNTGDFFTAQIGPESLLITRDTENRVRAYFNVCRHRGSRICEVGTAGNTKAFVCPYHRWSYSRDGELLGAPGSPDGVDFDYADWSLHEANCDTFFGSIFVYLGDDEPAALSSVLEPMVSDLDDLRSVESERTKVVHEEVYVIDANWKLMLENNMECYHCAGAHPSLGISCDYAKFSFERTGDGSVTQRLNAAHFPIREGMHTFSIDGDWVCKKQLGGGQLRDRFSAGYLVTPNFGGPVYFADHAVALAVTPLTRETTQLVCQWIVHEDAVEGEDYEVEKLIDVFHITNLEDGDLAAFNQRGVNSRRFVPGPNSTTNEPGIKMALNAYLAMMES